MNHDFETLRFQVIDEKILKITLHRPQVHNAINSTMMLELDRFWENFNSTPNHFSCIIFTGSGDKAFCAGADLKERNHLDTVTWQKHKEHLNDAMFSMIECPIPLIACVNGVAFGGGLELALACDFAYASDQANFSQSEVKLGLIPGAMGTQNLPRACGIRRAKELCLTGKIFSAKDALQYGIVNEIFPQPELEAEVLKTARMIADNAPLAVIAAKRALNHAINQHLSAGFQFELHEYQRILETKDRKEGISAFNEKRKARFEGL